MTSSRTLLVTPRTPRVSEAWLLSHAEAIRDNVVATATYEKGGTSWFHGRPNADLGHSLALNRYGVGRLTRLRARALPAEVERLEPTGAVVHYANLYDLLSPPSGPLTDLPTVVYVHGFDITWSPFRWCPIPYKNMGNTAAYRRRLIGYSEHVLYIANSEFSRNRMIDSGFPPERVRVCYLPVERTTPQVTRDPQAAGRIDLAFLGRFVGCKGPLQVIQAVEIARRGGADVNLTMIGDGPLFGQAEHLVSQLSLGDSVNLLGAIPNQSAMQHLAKSDALVLHNRTDERTGQVEAFGYAHAEALAHGVPVLTGASGGPSEFLSHGRNSMLVDPGDVDSQAEQMLNLAFDIDLRDELAAGAEHSSKEMFSASAHRAVITAALDEVGR